MNIAMTTLSLKILSQDKEYFVELAVDAVLRLKVSYFSSTFCFCSVDVFYVVACCQNAD
jgi:chaperonin GroEL (HSP60 family)